MSEAIENREQDLVDKVAEAKEALLAQTELHKYNADIRRYRHWRDHPMMRQKLHDMLDRLPVFEPEDGYGYVVEAYTGQTIRHLMPDGSDAQASPEQLERAYYQGFTKWPQGSYLFGHQIGLFDEYICLFNTQLHLAIMVGASEWRGDWSPPSGFSVQPLAPGRKSPSQLGEGLSSMSTNNRVCVFSREDQQSRTFRLGYGD